MDTYFHLSRKACKGHNLFLPYVLVEIQQEIFVNDAASEDRQKTRRSEAAVSCCPNRQAPARALALGAESRLPSPSPSSAHTLTLCPFSSTSTFFPPTHSPLYQLYLSFPATPILRITFHFQHSNSSSFHPSELRARRKQACVNGWFQTPKHRMFCALTQVGDIRVRRGPGPTGLGGYPTQRRKEGSRQRST